MLTLLSTLLLAEEPKVVYKKRTEIDFEAVDVEGTLKKPNQALIMENDRAIFNPLVQIRNSWHVEMIGSVEDIQ